MDADTDAQPNWNEDRAARERALTPLAAHAGIERRGDFVYMRRARQWGAGSLDEIFPECPRCGHTWTRPHENPFFTALLGRPVYSQFLTCESCLTAIDAEAANQKLEAKMHELELLGFTLVQRAWTFDTYPNQAQVLLRRARQFVHNPVHDILIYGNPGVGKTGLAVAIMRALWNDRKTVRITRASEILLALRGTDAEHTQRLMHALSVVDFLLIDDLSAIRRTEFWEDILNILIDMRQQSNKITIMTANITVGRDPSEELAKFFGYVAYDRLVERGELWNIKGTSGRREYKPRNEPTGQSRYEQGQRD